MLKYVVIAAALSLVGAGAAKAAIYDTGLVGNGQLGTSGEIDQHWTVLQIGGSFKDNAGKTTPPLAYIASSFNQFPFAGNYWSHPLTGSNWIVPTFGPDGQGVSLDPNKDGFYLYSTLLSVKGGALVTGDFLADNDVTKITLLDLKTFKLTTISAGEGSDTTPTAFSLGKLTSDPYVLSFTVDNFAQNGGNPSGLDVAMSSSVPEPATWAMMVLGFLGIGFLAHRRRSRPGLQFA
jgi:hypothetical protein